MFIAADNTTLQYILLIGHATSKRLLMMMIGRPSRRAKRQKSVLPRRFERRLVDSKSTVLTTTLWEMSDSEKQNTNYNLNENEQTQPCLALAHRRSAHHHQLKSSKQQAALQAAAAITIKDGQRQRYQSAKLPTPPRCSGRPPIIQAPSSTGEFQWFFQQEQKESPGTGQEKLSQQHCQRHSLPSWWG